VLQCVAVCCSVLQCVAEHRTFLVMFPPLHILATLLPGMRCPPPVAAQKVDVCVQRLVGSYTLQHTTTHCNTLQHDTVRNILHPVAAQKVDVCVQRLAGRYTLQHTATHCNTNAAKHAATHWHTLLHTTTHCCNTLQHTATHCNTNGARTRPLALKHTATRCNTLQHTATHCNTLQHTATHCN